MLCGAQPRSAAPAELHNGTGEDTAGVGGEPPRLPLLRNRPRNLRPSAASQALQHDQAPKVKRGSSARAPAARRDAEPGAAETHLWQTWLSRSRSRGAAAATAQGPRRPAPSAAADAGGGGAGLGRAGRVRAAAALPPCPPRCGAAPEASLRGGDAWVPVSVGAGVRGCGAAAAPLRRDCAAGAGGARNTAMVAAGSATGKCRSAGVRSGRGCAGGEPHQQQKHGWKKHRQTLCSLKCSGRRVFF